MPSLVLDPSFPSTAAVSSERAPASEASERAPAEASDDIVGVDDQEDTQQSTPIRGGVANDDRENEGGRGDSGGADNANDDDKGDGGGADDRFNWTIEGVEDLNKEDIRHMNAFYALLKKWYRGKEYTAGILTKADYDARVELLWSIKKGDMDCCPTGE